MRQAAGGGWHVSGCVCVCDVGAAPHPIRPVLQPSPVLAGHAPAAHCSRKLLGKPRPRRPGSGGRRRRMEWLGAVPAIAIGSHINEDVTCRVQGAWHTHQKGDKFIGVSGNKGGNGGVVSAVGAGGDGALRVVDLLTASPLIPDPNPHPIPIPPTRISSLLPAIPSPPNAGGQADVHAKPEQNVTSGTPACPSRIGLAAVHKVGAVAKPGQTTTSAPPTLPLSREIGLEAVDADAKFATTTSSTAPTASATSHLLRFRVDVPAEHEAKTDPGTPTQPTFSSSSSAELSSPFAFLMIARGSMMRRMISTPMGKPCSDPHTSGASVQGSAGRRR